jgi:hypothetical protein
LPRSNNVARTPAHNERGVVVGREVLAIRRR